MRILCVSAHPDDLEFGCAGSVARWCAEGHEVSYLIVTDGAAGTQDANQAGESLASLRRHEALAAAQVVGVQHVEFSNFPDGEVELSLQLRRSIASSFRKARPHRLLTMDPTPLPGGWFVNHPDHRAVGQATLDITITAGTTPGIFPELIEAGLEPWRGLREILIYGPAGGEFVVDVSPPFIDLKIEALLCHKSQVSVEVGSFMKDAAARVGSEHGLSYAESFHSVIPLGAPAEDL